MTKSMQSLKILVVAGALALISGFSTPARAAVPSNGVAAVARSMVKDQNGVVFGNAADAGWRVWVATAAGSFQLLDAQGNAPTCGTVHSIVVSSGVATDYAVAYDTAPSNSGANLTAANIPTNLGIELAPAIDRVTTGAVTQIVDVQFNNGVWLLHPQVAPTGSTHVYWRPCGNQSN